MKLRLHLLSVTLVMVYSGPLFCHAEDVTRPLLFKSLQVAEEEGLEKVLILGAFEGVPLYASHSHRNVEIAMLSSGTSVLSLSGVLGAFMQGCCPGDMCPGQTFCPCISNKDSWSPPPGGSCDGWDHFFCGNDSCQTSTGSCCARCPDTGPGCYNPPTVLCTNTIC